MNFSFYLIVVNFVLVCCFICNEHIYVVVVVYILLLFYYIAHRCNRAHSYGYYERSSPITSASEVITFCFKHVIEVPSVRRLVAYISIEGASVECTSDAGAVAGGAARRASERDLPARLAAEPVKPSKSTPALHHAPPAPHTPHTPHAPHTP